MNQPMWWQDVTIKGRAISPRIIFWIVSHRWKWRSTQYQTVALHFQIVFFSRSPNTTGRTEYFDLIMHVIIEMTAWRVFIVTENNQSPPIVAVGWVALGPSITIKKEIKNSQQTMQVGRDWSDRSRSKQECSAEKNKGKRLKMTHGDGCP